MFNWTLCLREQTGFLSPVGPNFKSAPIKHTYINGSKISIKLPRQKTYLPTKNITLGGAWDTEQLQGIYQKRNGVEYHYTTLLMREWDFNGSWFTGYLGGISMAATLISFFKPPEGLNFFHPRALEAGIATILTAYYGDRWLLDYSAQQWQGPINWRPLDNFPCAAARFNVTDMEVKTSGPDCYLVLPVSKTQMLLVDCYLRRSAVFTDIHPKPTVDEWIDIQPMLTLAEQVLGSVRVELSERAQAEQEEALRDLPLEERSLIKNYPPIKWDPPPRPPLDPSWDNDD